MELAVFKQRVAQRLGFLPVVGSLSPEDGEMIATGYGSLLAELGEHSMCWWGSDEDVPEQYADVLIGMTAAALVDEYEIEDPKRSALIAQYAFGIAPVTPGERRLRAMMAAGSNGDPAEAEYF